MLLFTPLKRIPLPNSLLLIGLTLVVLPHVPHLPAWLSVACFAVIGWRFLFDAGYVPLPNRFWRLVLLVIAILALLVTYRTLVGLQAGTALLVLMLTLKLFEMRGWRDVTVVVFLAFFVMVTSYLFSQSLLMGIYTLAVVVLLIASLISFQHAEQTIAAGSLRRNIRLATLILAQALPLALVLFVLFPRIPGPLWGLPDDAGIGQTGLSDELSPGRISRLVTSNAVAFRVRFKDEIPSMTQRYWRGPVMWRYDGRKWKVGDERANMAQLFDQQYRGRPLDYQVTLEPHRYNWLFALDIPASVPKGVFLTRDYQLLSQTQVNEVTRYAMRSYTDYRIEPDSLADPQHYLVLPEDIAPRSRQLVSQLASETASDSEMVDAVLGYFSSQPFYYTREPPLLFDDPVDEFLFETRRGFCGHYASAFTVMMRQAGIPARVVTGYYGGEMNPLADYMIVRQSDAHAWSEVWLQDRGWVRVDPTAAIPPSRVEQNVELVRRQPELRQQLEAERRWWQRGLHQAAYAWDALNNRWQQWVIGYNQGRQNALLKALGLEQLGWHGLVALLIGVLVFALLVIGVLLLVRFPRPGNRITRYYRRFLHKLGRKGINKGTAETPRQFSQRAARLQPALADHIEQITQDYLLLRYAQLDDQQQQRLFRQFVQNVRAFAV
jgi:transglutaminase-like putative cysteine protease